MAEVSKRTSSSSDATADASTIERERARLNTYVTCTPRPAALTGQTAQTGKFDGKSRLTHRTRSDRGGDLSSVP